MVGLSEGGKRLRIGITVYTQYRRVTDRQRDRRTDISPRHIVRAMHTHRAVKMNQFERKFQPLCDPSIPFINTQKEAIIIKYTKYTKYKEQKIYKRKVF